MQKNDAPGIKAIRMADGFPFRTVERNRITAIKKPLPEGSGRCHKAKKAGLPAAMVVTALFLLVAYDTTGQSTHTGTSQSAPAHGTAGNGGHAGTTQRTQRGTAGHALLGGGHIGAGDARRHKGGHQDDRKQFFHKSLHNTQQRISS